MTLKQKTQLQALLSNAHSNYEKELNAYAYFKVSDRALGQDLVQDTFLKTWGYLAKGGKIATMRAFLYHILNNRIVDEYRKHKTASLDVLIERGFEPSVDEAGSVSSVFDEQKLFHLIDRLSKTHQTVIRMRCLEDLSFTEIARLTGRSKNALAVQVHRGLKELKVLCSKLLV